MIRSLLRRTLQDLVKAFPQPARRVADFCFRELGEKPKPSAPKRPDLKAKVERQARQIELQKARLRERDHRLSAYKDKVGFYKHKLEAQKKEMEGLTRGLYARPVNGNGQHAQKSGEARPFDLAAFQEAGFSGPISVFAPAQCRLITTHLRQAPRIKPAEWSKGKAVSDYFWYELATQPVLLDALKQVLGDDVILWGATFIRREPGRAHPWHTDIEFLLPQRRICERLDRIGKYLRANRPPGRHPVPCAWKGNSTGSARTWRAERQRHARGGARVGSTDRPKRRAGAAGNRRWRGPCV